MFKDEFVELYTRIRKYCRDNALCLYVHATHGDIDSIFNEGLHTTDRVLEDMTFSFGYLDNSSVCGELKKFKYNDFCGGQLEPCRKYVLIALPYLATELADSDDRIGFWSEYIGKYTDERHVGCFSFKYTLLSKFIIGSVDAEKEEIRLNPYFTNSLCFDGIQDMGTVSVNSCVNDYERTFMDKYHDYRFELDFMGITRTSDMLSQNGDLLPQVIDPTDSVVLDDVIKTDDNGFIVDEIDYDFLFEDEEFPVGYQERDIFAIFDEMEEDIKKLVKR